MTSSTDITRIFGELNERYGKISDATILGLMQGKLKFGQVRGNVADDETLPPNLDEAEAAFRRYNCAIFTAFRGGYTLAQNLERNARLKGDMAEAGLRFRPVNGCYKEAGMEYPDIEYCYFVYNKDKMDDLEFFAKAYCLSEKYEQDSFLYKKGGLNNVAFLVATNDNAREYLRGDIYFTGRYFSHVEDVVAWTDCNDGRFSFLVKGMIQMNTNYRKIKLGEGDVFDTGEYGADGLVIISRDEQKEIVAKGKTHTATPMAKHIFKKENQTADAIHKTVTSMMKVMKDNRCRKIGFYCSVKVGDSFVDGARIAYDTLLAWARRNPKRFDWIVIADVYGDYSKIVNEKNIDN